MQEILLVLMETPSRLFARRGTSSYFIFFYFPFSHWFIYLPELIMVRESCVFEFTMNFVDKSA